MEEKDKKYLLYITPVIFAVITINALTNNIVYAGIAGAIGGIAANYFWQKSNKKE